MPNTKQIAVVGAGVAGLSFALYLHEKNKNIGIHIFSSTSLNLCNTQLAQGGIASAGVNNHDSFESHIKDTYLAGHKKGNMHIIKKVVEEAPKRIQDLINWGLNFDTNGTYFDLHKEGGHQHARILHVKDQTGYSLHQILIERARKCKSIYLHEFHDVIDINSIDTNFTLEIIDTLKQVNLRFKCHVVVLATGGSGQLFPQTTNTLESFGQGINLAQKLKLSIKDFDKIQFHPTSFDHPDLNPSFLISEAARGLGAFIVNNKQQRFLYKYDSRGELATRDVVTQAIWKEIRKQGNPNIYLDFRHLEPKLVKNALPFIYKTCLAYDFDLNTVLLPIQPAAHYQCGGIKVNDTGETSTKNIFAIGECAYTGLHGDNRLASNSLLEAIVFAHNAAECIADRSLVDANKTTSSLYISSTYRFIKLDPLFINEMNNGMKQVKEIALMVYKDRTLTESLKSKLSIIEKQINSKLNTHDYHPITRTLIIAIQNVQLLIREIEKYEKRKSKLRLKYYETSI